MLQTGEPKIKISVHMYHVPTKIEHIFQSMNMLHSIIVIFQPDHGFCDFIYPHLVVLDTHKSKIFYIHLLIKITCSCPTMGRN